MTKIAIAREPTSECISCPKCGSKNLDVFAQQQGYGWKKGAAGAIVLGPLGLLGGFIGKNKSHTVLTCKACLNSFSREQLEADIKRKRVEEEWSKHPIRTFLLSIFLATVFLVLLFRACSFVFDRPMKTGMYIPFFSVALADTAHLPRPANSKIPEAQFKYLSNLVIENKVRLDPEAKTAYLSSAFWQKLAKPKKESLAILMAQYFGELDNSPEWVALKEMGSKRLLGGYSKTTGLRLLGKK